MEHMFVFGDPTVPSDPKYTEEVGLLWEYDTGTGLLLHSTGADFHPQVHVQTHQLSDAHFWPDHERVQMKVPSGQIRVTDLDSPRAGQSINVQPGSYTVDVYRRSFEGAEDYCVFEESDYDPRADPPRLGKIMEEWVFVLTPVHTV
ncbi:hypothetical protein [Nocardiopsis rhodophaea]|uniref:hypothetical protein n=1 Tax=Nocardiopsis rhodophaea TaxID=280238 RepID=UPI0031CE2A30